MWGATQNRMHPALPQTSISVCLRLYYNIEVNRLIYAFGSNADIESAVRYCHINATGDICLWMTKTSIIVQENSHLDILMWAPTLWSFLYERLKFQKFWNFNYNFDAILLQMHARAKNTIGSHPDENTYALLISSLLFIVMVILNGCLRAERLVTIAHHGRSTSIFFCCTLLKTFLHFNI